MVCTYLTMTSDVIDKMVDTYNVDVLFWADKFKKDYLVVKLECF